MADWRRHHSASEAFVLQYKKQEDCDVFFDVEGKSLGAHKCFLQARSEVLRRIVKNWTADDHPIVMLNVSYVTFRTVLWYIYTDSASINNKNVFHLMHAAHYFEMDHLEKHCAHHLSRSVGQKNICAFMNEAINFKAKGLQDVCGDVFAQDTKAILQSTSFVELSLPALSALLDEDRILANEVYVFNWVLKWMVAECTRQGFQPCGTNMRLVIGKALYKIRFPTMNVYQFSKVTTFEGLLNNKEMAQIFQKITLPSDQGIQCPFSSVVRDTTMPLDHDVLGQTCICC